jgi:hypothetical protein
MTKIAIAPKIKVANTSLSVILNFDSLRSKYMTLKNLEVMVWLWQEGVGCPFKIDNIDVNHIEFEVFGNGVEEKYIYEHLLPLMPYSNMSEYYQEFVNPIIINLFNEEVLKNEENIFKVIKELK